MKRITVRIHDGTGTAWSSFDFNGGMSMRVPNVVPGTCERTIRTLALALKYLIQQYPEAVRSQVVVQLSDRESLDFLWAYKSHRIQEVPPYAEEIEPIFRSFQNISLESTPPVDG